MNKTDKDKICLLMLDTSTSVCNVALSLGTEIIISHHFQPEKAQHAAILPPVIDEVLKESKARGLKLSAIVISSGPGSYTGLRIGSSLSKGLAHGLGLPLIAISTLEMMAHGYSKEHNLSEETDTFFIPMIDARRMEVYSALYDKHLKACTQEGAIILTNEVLPYSEMKDNEIHIFGNGAKKCQDLWDTNLGIKKLIINGDFTPKADYMLDLALKRYEEKAFVNLAYWTPNYLKDYVAKVSKNKVLGI